MLKNYKLYYNIKNKKTITKRSIFLPNLKKIELKTINKQIDKLIVK
jgi:hypothetical protein